MRIECLRKLSEKFSTEQSWYFFSLSLIYPTYQVILVYTAAQKILARQLNGTMQYPVQVATALKLDNDTGAELFAGLMLLSQKYGNDLSAFYHQLEALATSHNYMVRAEAAYLLELNDQQIPETVEQNLSPFYDLDLDGLGLESSSLSIEGCIYPIGQMVKLIRPLDRDLRILSKFTGVEEKTLLYRTYMFMSKAGIPPDWLNDGDGGFSEHLEAISLRYSYTKPRVLAVKRAIARVVSELVDADILDEESALQFFGPRDKGADILTPGKRPNFVKSLDEKKFMLDTSNWLENIENNPRLSETLLSNEDGLNIIGEYTVLTSLNWGKAKQIFMSQIKGEPKPNEGWFIFGVLINGQTKDYHSLSDTVNGLIIVREETHGNFSTLSNWIAINPVLARFLGWHPYPSKIFAWADDDGNCLVESVYWMDGNIKMQPPHLYSEAGEGWYVMATGKAIAEIRAVERNLYQDKFIYRSSENDSQSQQHTMITELS